jgi:AraC-like DNA-binding protein
VTPYIQKLPLPANQSFIAQRYTTPQVEAGWHQHPEYELILFTEGTGRAFIGKHTGNFEPGDIFFLGSNLPHLFQNNGQPITALMVQFTADCWGPDFLNMPECRVVKQVLDLAAYGLQVTGHTRTQLANEMTGLTTVNELQRIILLLQCLQSLSVSKELTLLSTPEVMPVNAHDKECIDRIFTFTRSHFRDPISLRKVAAVACMSVPSFCYYFKRRTQKTYIDFLNEVRINYACQQLLSTDLPVTDICYDSGYNTIGHFHRQFLKLRKTTPLQYRKQHTGELLIN